MRKTFLMLASLLAVAPAAMAEELSMPQGKPSAAAEPHILPAKGATMQKVSQTFGAPVAKHAAVGGGSRKTPPITRWDYPGFSVFFEKNHVIDAVIPDQPVPVQKTEGLKAE